MTETRPPYAARQYQPRVIYPGSQLERLVESLDDLAKITPDAYPFRLNNIHTKLALTLNGTIAPRDLLSYLVSKREES